MEGMGALIGIGLWILVVFLGYTVGKEKNMGGLGVVLTLFFSIVGLIAIAVIPAKQIDKPKQ